MKKRPTLSNMCSQQQARQSVSHLLHAFPKKFIGVYFSIVELILSLMASIVVVIEVFVPLNGDRLRHHHPQLQLLYFVFKMQIVRSVITAKVPFIH